ncbi:YciI family protein [Tahibacter soli]|uniref:YciI family protein n=1 Tax=Tahibacter soli TaxID=2983605 RepID=A0A9X4BHI6_9GAMM|nr:YciI family protein [Tahibacter soli]MDC8012433.1 YciI family protein [Tahibacter soli]
MRYLVLFTPDPAATAAQDDPASLEQMDMLTKDNRDAGRLLATGGLGSNATRVRRSGGAVDVVDGPFAETKEVVAGFALVEVATPEEALAMAHEFLAIAGDGTAVMHPVFDDVCGTASTRNNKETLS